MEKQKQEIISAIDKLDDVDTLHQIDSILKKDDLKRIFNEVWNTPGLQQKDKDIVFSYIMNLQTSAKDKFNFLKSVLNNKTTAENIRQQDNVFTLRDIIHDDIRNTETFNKIYDWFINFKLSGQQGKGATGVGRCEAFLMFFGKDSRFAPIGDVQIENDLIEVKFGHANLGYNGVLVSKANEKIVEIYKKYNAEHTLDFDVIAKDHNAFNFKRNNQFQLSFEKGLSPEVAKNILLESFQLCFHEKDINTIVEKMITADGKLVSNKEVYELLAKYIFNKYKNNEQFSYMMCFSEDGQKAVNIKDYNDFSKYDFKYDNFSWGGKQQQTIAITLKNKGN